jgi:hypothetical protein
MASGQVNRVKRPNTWLQRPMLQNREESSCQTGAVHTWHKADVPNHGKYVRCRGDCVAKLPKCRATNFPRKDETSDNHRSMQAQTRYRNRL